MNNIEVKRGFRTNAPGYEYPVHVNGELYTICRNINDAFALADRLAA